jgi:hypothetical protein
MEDSGKQTPSRGWPKAIALMYGISKLTFLDASIVPEWANHENLEINVDTFIFSYLINSVVRPL